MVENIHGGHMATSAECKQKTETCMKKIEKSSRSHDGNVHHVAKREFTLFMRESNGVEDEF